MDKSTTKEEEEKDMTHAYADDLKTDIYTDVNANPKALVHATEWRKIMNGTTLDEEACARPSSTTTTFATGRLTDSSGSRAQATPLKSTPRSELG